MTEAALGPEAPHNRLALARAIYDDRTLHAVERHNGWFSIESGSGAEVGYGRSVEAAARNACGRSLAVPFRKQINTPRLGGDKRWNIVHKNQLLGFVERVPVRLPRAARGNKPVSVPGSAWVALTTEGLVLSRPRRPGSMALGPEPATFVTAAEAAEQLVMLRYL